MLHLFPKPEPEEQIESAADPAPAQEPEDSAAGSVTQGILELCNPFEALESILEQPGVGLALVALFAIVILAALILSGLWSVVQETFSGGPPQGLGLR